MIVMLPIDCPEDGSGWGDMNVAVGFLAVIKILQNKGSLPLIPLML